MTTPPPAEMPLKWRWLHALQANPPTWPVWQEARGLMYAVAMGLWQHANLDGTNIYPSAERVAEMIGARRNSVQKYRQDLVELRMIELVSKGKGKGSSSVYRLREPSEWRNHVAEFEQAMASTPEPEPVPAPESVPAPRPPIAWTPSQGATGVIEEGAGLRFGASERARQRAALRSRDGDEEW